MRIGTNLLASTKSILRAPPWLPLAAVAILCSLSYLAGVWHHGGLTTSPASTSLSIATTTTSATVVSPSPPAATRATSSSSARLEATAAAESQMAVVACRNAGRTWWLGELTMPRDPPGRRRGWQVGDVAGAIVCCRRRSRRPLPPPLRRRLLPPSAAALPAHGLLPCLLFGRVDRHRRRAPARVGGERGREAARVFYRVGWGLYTTSAKLLFCP